MTEPAENTVPARRGILARLFAAWLLLAAPQDVTVAEWKAHFEAWSPLFRTWRNGVACGWAVAFAVITLQSDSYGGLEGYIVHLRGNWTDSIIPDIISLAILAWIPFKLTRMSVLAMIEGSARDAMKKAGIGS